MEVPAWCAPRSVIVQKVLTIFVASDFRSGYSADGSN
ncbi:unnamed protein product [Brassica rapa subsp. narinosa]